MVDLPERPRSVVRAQVVPAVLLALVLALVVWWLHGPVRSLALTGDTYQLVQQAHAAAHEPALLFSGLDSFYRPSATWLLVVDRLWWGGFNAAGYRTTSLVLHAVAAFLLAVAGRKIGLGRLAAAAVAIVWATSPFTSETVFVVSSRNSLLLLVPWLLMVIVWPRSEEPWSWPRVVGVGLMLVLAAAAKETWVVTPGLVAALEYERTRSWRSTAVPTAVAACAVIVYLIAYAVLFGSSKDYMELGSHVVAKIPSQIAGFLYLAEPMVDRFSVGWTGVIGLVVTTAITIACLRWRVSGTWVALFLFLAPTLPTLAVPYMPQRYLTIPYAGFVLLLALWFGGLRDRRVRWRRALFASAAAVTVLVTAAGGVITRADLEDYRRVAVSHQQLVDEAKMVAGVVGDGNLVVVVRDEATLPLLDVAASPIGLPKLAYIRNDDPYGLIDTAALFEWVLARETIRVDFVSDVAAQREGLGGRILIHRNGGFVDAGTTGDVAEAVRGWRHAGRGVRVVQRGFLR